MTEITRFVTKELESGEYPNIAAQFTSGDPIAEWREIIREIGDSDRFGRGLDRLLDGIEAELRSVGAIRG